MIKIAVCMSAGASKREWDIQNYIETIRRVSLKYKAVWALIGNGENAENDAVHVLREIQNTEVINLVNKTTLRQVGAVLKCCDVYLGGDTGPMHMAAATGTAGVVLSCHPIGADWNHSNAPERFGPWRVKMTVLRPLPLSGCEHGCDMRYAHCINQIRVDDVVESMETIIMKYMVEENH